MICKPPLIQHLWLNNSWSRMELEDYCEGIRKSQAKPLGVCSFLMFQSHLRCWPKLPPWLTSPTDSHHSQGSVRACAAWTWEQRRQGFLVWSSLAWELSVPQIKGVMMVFTLKLHTCCTFHQVTSHVSEVCAINQADQRLIECWNTQNMWPSSL